MGKIFDNPLETTLTAFVSDRGYWDEPEDEAADRDTQVLLHASAKGAGREAMAPSQSAHLENTWGGGLRRVVSADARDPHHGDDRIWVSRYVPVGFARYKNPTVDPAAYNFYYLDGWRVAIHHMVPASLVHDMLLRIRKHGPESVGYVRLGDTLVSAALGPGARQTLADSETRYNRFS